MSVFYDIWKHVFLTVSCYRMEQKIDYKKDGAVSELNATAEEYQFVTKVLDGRLETDRLIRIGTKALTQRELDAERKKKEEEVGHKSKEKPVACKTTTMAPEKMRDLVNQCLLHKEEGNEAFKAGQYGQAVMLYSLAIDDSAGLQNVAQEDIYFKERHICYANRSACFLKLGHHEKALADAQTCIDLEPDYIKGIFRKGLALHAMGQYQEAMPILAQCLQLEPKNKQVKEALQFCEVKFQKARRTR